MNETINQPEMDEEMQSAEYESRFAILAAVGETISKLRDDAVKGRSTSGIEQEWLEDEEHYEGIDDANRSEMPQKALTTSGPVRLSSGGETTKKGKRSTIFLNITRPYVDAASARVSDMLLPTDDRNWAIRPTPMPDLILASKDETPIQDANGQPVMRQAKPEEMPQQEAQQPNFLQRMGIGKQPEQMPQQVPVKVKDLALEAIEQATKASDKAQRRMDDWLQECRYHAEVRLVIEDSARVGTGVLKGPFPIKTRRKAITREMGKVGLIIKEDIAPTSKRISIWNFYPDPACGDNIHNGKYVFEYDELTARKLADLKGVDGYIPEAIDECLTEGPKSLSTGMTAKQEGYQVNEKSRFGVWYFHGYLDREELEAAGCECPEGGPEQYPAIVTLVNDKVIKASMSPLDSGEFPYDVMVWQQRAGSWAGIGVSRQMRTCQRGVNASARNLMDNAGLSAGPQVVIDRAKVVPADGSWELTPRKIWWTAESAEITDARHAFQVVNISSLQQELMAILQLFMKLAEDVTGLPMLIQGQQGKAPDTVGGMTMLNNNATSVLRRITRTFDDRVTEPHIGRYYEWLLMYGEDDSEKGDFAIDARGSSALIERDQQSQAMVQLLGASLNPAYGVDPELVMQETLKSWRLDPKRLEYTEEKKQEMAQRQPPPAPQVQAAQLREEGQTARTQMELEAEAAENEKDRALNQWIKQIDAHIEAAKMEGDKEMALDDLKGSLTRDAMKLRTQMRLAGSKAAPQVANPVVEPLGRAPEGQAFQK